jgi:hypothetical protein
MFRPCADPCDAPPAMTRNARRAGPTLRLPARLLDALAGLEGRPPRQRAGGASHRRRRHSAESGADAGARGGFGAYLRDSGAAGPPIVPITSPRTRPSSGPCSIASPPGASCRRGGGRALELGCGPGTGVAALALWAAQRGESWHLTATDALPEATQAAATLFSALAFPLETAVVDSARHALDRCRSVGPGGPVRSRPVPQRGERNCRPRATPGCSIACAAG